MARTNKRDAKEQAQGEEKANEVQASAAAMDELNLDDLFMGGSGGDNLFDEMEMDLGDLGDITQGGGDAGGGAKDDDDKMDENVLGLDFEELNPDVVAAGDAKLAADEAAAAEAKNKRKKRKKKKGNGRKGKKSSSVSNAATVVVPEIELSLEPTTVEKDVPEATTGTKKLRRKKGEQGSKATDRKRGASDSSTAKLEDGSDADAFAPLPENSSAASALAPIPPPLPQSAPPATGHHPKLSRSQSVSVTSSSASSRPAPKRSSSTTVTPAPQAGASSPQSGALPSASFMPPPLPRQGPSGIVAAAGRFGGHHSKMRGTGLPTKSSAALHKHGTRGAMSKMEKQNSASSQVSQPQSKKGFVSMGPRPGLGSQAPSSAPKGKGRSGSFSSGGVAGEFAPSPATAKPAKGQGARHSRTASSSSTGAPPQESSPTATSDRNFCGLSPSPTLFYPFMPSLPHEPSMRRCHKLYRLMDEIHAAYQGLQSTWGDSVGEGRLNDNEPLYKLLQAEWEAHHHYAHGGHPPEGKNPSASAALPSNLYKAKKGTAELSRADLASELKSILSLVGRQHDFLAQNLENMERWCRAKFSESEYSAIYGGAGQTGGVKRRRASSSASTIAPAAVKVLSPGGTTMSSPISHQPPQPELAGMAMQLPPRSLSDTARDEQGSSTLPVKAGEQHAMTLELSPLHRPIVKVKVKCTGFKEPKMSGVLVAHLQVPHGAAASPIAPLSAVSMDENTYSVTGADLATLRSTGVLKQKQLPDGTISGRTSPHGVTEEVVVPYSHRTPSERRQQIVEAISSKAKLLERELVAKDAAQSAKLDAQAKELDEIVQNDEFVMCNTRAMWSWFEKSSYLKEFTKDDIREVFRHAWQPELGGWDIDWYKADPMIVKGLADRNRAKEAWAADVRANKKKRTHSAVCSSPLFDRLQSLLVEEEGSDEESADPEEGHGIDAVTDRYENDISRATASVHHTVIPVTPSGVVTPTPSSTNPSSDNELDLSALSLDQRTYIQLRSLRLVDTPFLPFASPAVVEDYCSASDDEDEVVSPENPAPTNFRDLTPAHPLKENKNDIDNVLCAMQADLFSIHHETNSRTARLQSAATVYLAELDRVRRMEEENTVVITKYQQLMKKQNETKKAAAARAKSSKKGEDWIPW